MSCMPKMWRMEKTWRMAKPWRMGKNMADAKTMADCKNMAALESVTPGKMLASMKMMAQQEKQAELLKNSLLFRLGRISNCWLLPGPADEHILLLLMLNLEHVVSKWWVGSCFPAFMGGLSPVLYRLLVPARHAQKWSKPWRLPKSWRLPGFSLFSAKP